MIFSIISNIVIDYQNNKYENLYQEKNYTLYGEIVSNKQAKEYKNVYKFKVIKSNEQKKEQNTYLYINTSKNINLNYGDIIKINGKFEKANSRRNYKGFDYEKYLRTNKIYGTIITSKVEKIGHKDTIFSIANNVANKIEEKISQNLSPTQASICKGLIIGRTDDIEEKIQENFRITNISHILAISGTHIVYIVSAINLVFNKLIGKNKTKILIILILIFYMFIVGFTPSMVRAGIMGILYNLASLVSRKNNFATSISISLLLILINNPYSILNIGLQLSYLATVGIVLFNKMFIHYFSNLKFIKKNIYIKTKPKLRKLIKIFQENLAIMLSAQIMLFPVLIYNFNILGIYFILANLLAGIITGPMLILSIIFIITPINFITQIVSLILSNLFSLLILISDLSNLPKAKIYLPTPNLFFIILYYIVILLIRQIYKLYNSKKKVTNSEFRFRNLISIVKYKIKKLKIKIAIIFMAIIIILNIIPKDLRIHFIEVGQGDSTFIETPHNKTILIDGGGSLSESFDVGEKTLLPYILDRGYTKIDYIFITHFDQDHVGGILTLLEEINVGKVFIGEQFEECENYHKFINIIKQKKLEIAKIKKGDKIIIDNIIFNILFPDIENPIKENILNNNSIVMQMKYKSITTLFTGDIEEIAEEQIIKENIEADILKIAHHGSKTSSTQKFLEKVKPKIALIGVGENNKFGHPNIEVIKRLENLNTKIFRTAQNGEITIKINHLGKIKIKTMNQ